MTSKIVSIDGREIPGVEPVSEVVEMLRRYLERAERGEIVAIAIASVKPDRTPASEWFHSSGFKPEISCATMMLHHRIGASLLDE